MTAITAAMFRPFLGLAAGFESKTKENNSKNKGVQKMKVILVNGSPNQSGCTYTALREVADTLEKNNVSTEIIWLGNKPVAQCIACWSCFETGKCFVNDTVNVFVDKAKKVDGFVFGSPVHFANPSGALKSFMDRVFLGRMFAFQGKPAASVVSCRRGGASSAFEAINKYFTISNMPIVSSQYWNMVHGNTPDEVRQDLEGMQTMRTLGSNMAWLIKSIEAGRKAGIALPVHEEWATTNFIR